MSSHVQGGVTGVRRASYGFIKTLPLGKQRGRLSANKRSLSGSPGRYLLVGLGLVVHVLLHLLDELLQLPHQLQVAGGQLLRGAPEHVPHRGERPATGEGETTGIRAASVWGRAGQGSSARCKPMNQCTAGEGVAQRSLTQVERSCLQTWRVW